MKYKKLEKLLIKKTQEGLIMPQDIYLGRGSNMVLYLRENQVVGNERRSVLTTMFYQGKLYGRDS